MQLISIDFTSVIILLAGLCAYIAFLITQQETLKAIQPQNRLIAPVMIWLQLIPIFQLGYQFIVVTKISNSIKKEIASWQSDSILGFENAQSVEILRTRPTHEIGIAYCVMLCFSIFPVIGNFAAIAFLICWILYWVKLNEYKRMIQLRRT